MAKDAIRTLGYDLEQEFDFTQGRRVPREFVARNAIEVRVDEIARVGELLDVVVQGGATSVSGVRFDIQDREKVERDALRLAVVDARSRAEAAAAGAGRAIDRIIKIEDARERQRSAAADDDLRDEDRGRGRRRRSSRASSRFGRASRSRPR